MFCQVLWTFPFEFALEFSVVVNTCFTVFLEIKISVTQISLQRNFYVSYGWHLCRTLNADFIKTKIRIFKENSFLFRAVWICGGFFFLSSFCGFCLPWHSTGEFECSGCFFCLRYNIIMLSQQCPVCIIYAFIDIFRNIDFIVLIIHSLKLALVWYIWGCPLSIATWEIVWEKNANKCLYSNNCGDLCNIQRLKRKCKQWRLVRNFEIGDFVL